MSARWIVLVVTGQAGSQPSSTRCVVLESRRGELQPNQPKTLLRLYLLSRGSRVRQADGSSQSQSGNAAEWRLLCTIEEMSGLPSSTAVSSVGAVSRQG